MVCSKLGISSDGSSLYWGEFNKDGTIAMMFKQIVLLPLVLLVVGCGGGDDTSEAEIKPDPMVAGCGNSGPGKFDITDVDVEVLPAPEPKTYPVWVIGSSFDVAADTQYDGIIFSLESQIQYLAANKTELQRTKQKGISFSLFNSAFACSPIPPTTDEKITDIKITSSAPFNTELASGAVLNEKFNVVFTHSETPYYDYDPVGPGVLYYSLEKYLAQEGVVAGYGIQLKLNEAPEYAGEHIFFIEMTLDSGEVFSMETPEVSLINKI